MRILVTISGARIEAILGQVAARVGLDGENEWLALHVTDTRPLDEVGGLGRGLLGRGRRAGEMLARIQETAAASAGRELALAETWLTGNGLPHRLLSRSGRSEREIIAAAAEERADLIAIGAGLGTDPGPGAYPLSPIARFVVDHALCDVLLLRPPDPEESDWLPPPPAAPRPPHPRG